MEALIDLRVLPGGHAYYLYDGATGRIRSTGSASVPGLVPAQGPLGEAVGLGTADWRSQYVLDGALVARPVLPAFDKTAIAADDVDTATLAGLPVPCTVRIDGVVHSVTDGVLEFTAAYPGTYRIEIRHFPYRDFTAEITAT